MSNLGSVTVIHVLSHGTLPKNRTCDVRRLSPKPEISHTCQIVICLTPWSRGSVNIDSANLNLVLCSVQNCHKLEVFNMFGNTFIQANFTRHILNTPFCLLWYGIVIFKNARDAQRDILNIVGPALKSVAPFLTNRAAR